MRSEVEQWKPAIPSAICDRGPRRPPIRTQQLPNSTTRRLTVSLGNASGSENDRTGDDRFRPNASARILVRRGRSGRAAGIAEASVRLGVTLATERQRERRAGAVRLVLDRLEAGVRAGACSDPSKSRGIDNTASPVEAAAVDQRRNACPVGERTVASMRRAAAATASGAPSAQNETR